jgi:uncharacterized protein
MFPGFGTVVNVATVVIGASLGLLLGHRLPARTRATVTDALGLVTLLIGGLSAVSVTSADLRTSVGPNAPVLIVLGSLLVGGILGSMVDIEGRLEGFGDWLRRRLTRPAAVADGTPQAVRADALGTDPTGTGTSTAAPDVEVAARARFIEGFVTASLVFCVGPLTILGALSDGLGLGASQLLLKSVLDGFAAIAFAASLGAGVLASAVAVAVIQGALTLVGFLLGGFLPAADLDAITATGGLLLLGVALRLLQIKLVPVGNLLPALLVAPLLVELVASLR